MNYALSYLLVSLVIILHLKHSIFILQLEPLLLFLHPLIFLFLLVFTLLLNHSNTALSTYAKYPNP